ncbi:hypothetical protein AMS68_003458 [Peltaster fructicola]|uniref:Calcineurin-like phosphoesterase domain-containing protein n=1 Tax=Peltaster fructicola TaxID=286661 RepID=A0A6H0XTE7_9PEZI|nr:hypothetical protein AMS68_003458 [Peltaster fructicola]
MTGKAEEYHKTLDMLKQIDAPVKIVIAGNHDLSLDREFVLSHTDDQYDNRQPLMSAEQAQQRWQDVREIWTSPKGRAKQEGVTFLDEGVHLITLANGASVNVYASPYTPEFCDWAFAYERYEDRFNEKGLSLQDAHNIAINPLPRRSGSARPIDIAVTHGPAWLRLDLCSSGDSAGCPHLLQALMRARPLIYCCGHIHEAWGCERVTWSDNADSVDLSKTSIRQFRKSGWREAIASKGEAVVDLCDVDQDTSTQRAVYCDLSSEGAHIRAGKETAFINASIMDTRYRPSNAPWLVDIDLLKDE